MDRVVTPIIYTLLNSKHCHLTCLSNNQVTTESCLFSVKQWPGKIKAYSYHSKCIRHKKEAANFLDTKSGIFLGDGQV